MNTKDAAYLFHQGTYNQAYEFFGSHIDDNGKAVFRTWAPNAQAISIVGTFNEWDPKHAPMTLLPESGGIWEGEAENIKKGDLYKFAVVQANGDTAFKADPFARMGEVRPATASVFWPDEGFEWTDKKWQRKQIKAAQSHEPGPMNIYEMHLGSWKTHEDGSPLSYEELAEQLPAYLKEMEYTHVEIMPVMEHPFDGSWGYQQTGYFAPTSRYGTPEGFKKLVDSLHNAGIAVILDWVPGHFCKDAHGLYKFDGTNQYEANEHPQWGTMEFDYARPEVRTFLTSNAYYWFKEYHADGLRIDGVASMLYLNYGYDDEWRKNELGGNDDLNAVSFLRHLNTVIFQDFPYAVMAAEESTAYPMVSWPVNKGGLGFNYKWDMGWMHDTLSYMQTDPYCRSQFHNKLTFSMAYAFSENFILPLSHDEVVHGKGTILNKMFGEDGMKFDEMRLLLAFMFTHSGKKLNFMGQEFAPFTEWRYYEALEWFMLNEEKHAGYNRFIKKLNRLYKREKALWQIDNSWEGFEWIDADNASQSIVSFRRMAESEDDELICVLNFLPSSYEEYQVGVEQDTSYRLLLNTDDADFGGSGFKVKKTVKAGTIPANGRKHSIKISVPPMSALIYKVSKKKAPKTAQKTAAKDVKEAVLVSETPAAAKKGSTLAEAPKKRRTRAKKTEK